MKMPNMDEGAWVDWYEKKKDADMSNATVAVDDKRLVYHNPMEIPSTTDMDTMTIREASEEGAEACTHCFNEIHKFHNGFINAYIGRL